MSAGWIGLRSHCCWRGEANQRLLTMGVSPLWVMELVQHLHVLELTTQGPGFLRLNERLNAWIAQCDLQKGVLHLTCLHTSASLTINENADPRVLRDLTAWMQAVVPQDGLGPADGGGQRHPYQHDDEGPDDMPAHIRTALTAQTMSLSVDQGRLLLGIWQAVYLWEHRSQGSNRRVACHLIGSLRTETPSQQAPRTHAATPQTLLNLRNSERINQAIQDRFDPQAWESSDGVDTEVDLLIDRLHQISDEPS